ncbi:MAG: acyl-CoA synthetase [Acidobacteriota bacterium]
MAERITIRDLSDIAAIERIPVEERCPETSTLELIERGAAIDPGATAIHFIAGGEQWDQSQEITFAQLLARVRQTANLFTSLGIGPEDVVTYLLPNLPQTHFVLWGAEAAGIANPINPLLEAHTIRDICNAAGTKVLVALGEMPGTDIWQKVESFREEIPTLEKIVRVMGPSDEAAGIIGYEEGIDASPADRLTSGRVFHPDDIASLYHTGGTTGTPKLARRSHRNEIVLASNIVIAADLSAGETVMCGLPLFHCNGTCITGLAPFSVGASVVLLSPSGYRDQGVILNFFKIVERYRPVFFSTVPTVLGVLLNVPKGGHDISSLRYVICGAAPLSVELFNRFEAYSGMKIMEGYGLTEVACASAVNPRDGERKIGSIGIHLPYNDFKVAILDSDGAYLRDAENDEIGVIAVRGPCVFSGYVEEVHNRGIWINEEWFNTGDLGRRDSDGYLWLTGRRKELIIRGGHNIDPATIEEPLYEMEAVQTAAAVGRPDAYAGEVPVAYVQLKPGAEVSEDEILEWARERIGERAAVPKAVHIVDEIPLTAVGKVFKPALRWDATRKVYEEELAALGNLATSVSVRVGEDPIHGTKATIRIECASDVLPETVRKTVADILELYTVHFEVET